MTEAPAAVSLYAAGSLKSGLTWLARAYESAAGVRVALRFGASGLLRERIEDGDPADVFASADTFHPQLLAASGRWQRPRVFARNRMCAMVRSGLDAAPDALLDTMLRSDVRVGTSTPGADPSGDYALEVFRRAGALRPGAQEILLAKHVRLTGSPKVPKPPPGCYTYAWIMAEGQADVFLTYRTNAVAAARDVPGLQVVDLPPSLEVEAAYALTVRRGAEPPVEGFARMLLDTPAQAMMQALGFGPGGTPPVSR